MKRLFVLALVCLAPAGLHPAQAQTTWQVRTEKGLAVVITDIKVGRFQLVGGKTEVTGKDSRGQPVRKTVGGENRFFENEMSVTLQPDAGFGHRVVLPKIPDGDRIVLEVRTVAPRTYPSPKGPSHNVDSTRAWTSQEAGRAQTMFWRFGETKDKSVLGVWVRRISQGGKLLGEATFRVVP